MTSTPTLEQFMSEHQPEEDDAPDGMYTLGPSLDPRDNSAIVVPRQPLESIAHSLDRMLAIAEHHELEETEADRLREAHDDLDAKYAVLFDLVAEVEAIIKPSSSKLANTVREAIDRWRDPQVEAPEPVVEAPEAVVPQDPDMAPPDKDADVEEWRAYAAARGVTGDLSQTNRSQIRTLLGIPQV